MTSKIDDSAPLGLFLYMSGDDTWSSNGEACSNGCPLHPCVRTRGGGFGRLGPDRGGKKKERGFIWGKKRVQCRKSSTPKAKILIIVPPKVKFKTFKH